MMTTTMKNNIANGDSGGDIKSGDIIMVVRMCFLKLKTNLIKKKFWF